MRVITAPQKIPQYAGDVRVFLAGGITNCPEWQDEIIGMLSHVKRGILLNPRRKDFPIGDPNAALEQITWEFSALGIADIFSMWFCNADSDQPICMYELGRHLAIAEEHGVTDSHIMIGVESGYRREADVRIQTKLVDSDIIIRATLQEHADAITNAVTSYF